MDYNDKWKEIHTLFCHRYGTEPVELKGLSLNLFIVLIAGLQQVLDQGKLLFPGSYDAWLTWYPSYVRQHPTNDHSDFVTYHEWFVSQPKILFPVSKSIRGVLTMQNMRELSDQGDTSFSQKARFPSVDLLHFATAPSKILNTIEKQSRVDNVKKLPPSTLRNTASSSSMKAASMSRGTKRNRDVEDVGDADSSKTRRIREERTPFGRKGLENPTNTIQQTLTKDGGFRLDKPANASTPRQQTKTNNKTKETKAKRAVANNQTITSTGVLSSDPALPPPPKKRKKSKPKTKKPSGKGEPTRKTEDNSTEDNDHSPTAGPRSMMEMWTRGKR